MVNRNCDDWFKASRDVSDKLGENLIDEDVAYNQVKAEHDWDVEDADEVLTSEQAEYASDWVEVELAAPEEVAKDNQVYSKANVVNE